MSEPIVTKRCSHCKEIKPISEFYKNHNRKDGYWTYCKICDKKRRQNKDYDKRYAQSEKGQATKRRYIQSEKGRATQKQYWIRNPNRYKARNALRSAVLTGKLPYANSLICHFCPAKAEDYHHHLGYEPEHWLHVIPVCAICHSNITIAS